MHLFLAPFAISTLIIATTAADLVANRDNPPAFVYPSDAPYGVPTENLSSILTCPNGYPTAEDKPVLLVHGLGSTGNESWGFGYVPALTSLGYKPCYITLPDREVGDLQVCAAYVAYNMYYLAHIAGKNIQAIAHSAGNPSTQWALRFWPGVREVVTSYTGLSPPLYGIDSAAVIDSLCPTTNGAVFTCEPGLLQLRTGSNFFAALDFSGHVAEIPTSLIWSETDEIVIPAEENAQLTNATSISVQQICAGRTTDHFTMLIDAVGFALATDALAHEGVASLTRVQTQALTLCNEIAAQGMNATIPKVAESIFEAVVDGVVLSTPKVADEPAVKPYAQIAYQKTHPDQ